jgi:hypothetical protein
MVVCRPRLGIERLDAHQPHQPLHPFAVDGVATLASQTAIRREPKKGRY